MSARRRRFSPLLYAVLGIAALVCGLFLVLRHARPALKEGPEADALAHKIEGAIHLDAWQRTGAVRWTFAGNHHHLWDRKRQLAQVRWGEVDVLLDLTKQQGKVMSKGKEVFGPEQRKLLDKAYSYWVNDSFWLNPLAKLFDPGVTRSLAIAEDKTPSLMISYNSGGLTPGDSYLWLVGRDGRPRAWRMWVSILPIGGLEASWDGWTLLSTGALVATRHKIAVLDLTLDHVAGAQDLQQLVPGPDPFAALMGASTGGG